MRHCISASLVIYAITGLYIKCQREDIENSIQSSTCQQEDIQNPMQNLVLLHSTNIKIINEKDTIRTLDKGVSYAKILSLSI